VAVACSRFITTISAKNNRFSVTNNTFIDAFTHFTSEIFQGRQVMTLIAIAAASEI
jgi:hypothetical protein